MNKRLLLLVVLLALMFLGSATQVQSTNANSTQTTILAGGAYQLYTTTQQVNGVIGSDRYQLAPSLSADETGCCCMGFLPCVIK